MFVLGLLTCVVLRAFSAQAEVAKVDKVDKDFDCKKFFYQNKEPTGMDQNAKKICQCLERNIYYYATLYSVPHKIPLYSAYIFNQKCSSDSGSLDRWHLEPQISNPDDDKYCMVRETQRNKNTYKGNQATSDDYSDTGYDRGHLNPNSFQCGDGRTATFTLTNAAPMDPCFNRNHWAKWEKSLRSFLGNQLSSDGGSATAYIVTGTVPKAILLIPQKEISEDPERVTVPSHIWTAVCYKHHSDDTKSFSFGYMGKNQPEDPGISLTSVSNLNAELSGLYTELSKTQRSIKIFLGDCFGDNNNQLSQVKEAFKKLSNLPGNTGVQMKPDVQNMYSALKRAASSSSQASDSHVKLNKLTAELAFDSMDAYYTIAEDLKGFAGSACLIVNATLQERNTKHDELRKRDVSVGSDAVICLLVPEKQKTAADGSQCSSISESTDTCECTSGSQTKPCCSSPCLYQHKLKGYRCNSGQALIPCSPRYSLITAKGERCKDDHPCATYGYNYYWCKTVSGSWDFCSPPLWRSKAANGKYCRSNHACANYGESYMWCYTDDQGNYDKCCTSDDCFSTVNGQSCRSDHPCGYYKSNYLWCYTDDKNNWAQCCTQCSQ